MSTHLIHLIFLFAVACFGRAAAAQPTGNTHKSLGVNLGLTANLPKEPLGFALTMGGQKWGIYIDLKVSDLAPNNPDSLARFDAKTVEGLLPLLNTDEQTSSTNLALAHRVNARIWIYAGVGMRKHVVHKEFLDTLGVISPFGFRNVSYWTEDKRTARHRASVLGGFLLRPLRLPVSLQNGAESVPKV